MQRLAKSDPLVVCINDADTGENIIAGSGELHIEICLKDLIEEYAQIEIIKSEPIVAYRETVREKSSKQAMSKSNNSHNRLYVTAEPLQEELVVAVENNEIPFRDNKKKQALLISNFGFDKQSVNKVWGFGPNGEGPNMIFDLSVGCQYMHEIKDHVVSGFEQATK